MQSLVGNGSSYFDQWVPSGLYGLFVLAEIGGDRVASVQLATSEHLTFFLVFFCSTIA